MRASCGNATTREWWNSFLTWDLILSCFSYQRWRVSYQVLQTESSSTRWRNEWIYHKEDWELLASSPITGQVAQPAGPEVEILDRTMLLWLPLAIHGLRQPNEKRASMRLEIPWNRKLEEKVQPWGSWVLAVVALVWWQWEWVMEYGGGPVRPALVSFRLTPKRDSHIMQTRERRIVKFKDYLRHSSIKFIGFIFNYLFLFCLICQHIRGENG